MLSIIMPIAGMGSRFSKAGIPQPKPIIEVEGRPMAYWALASLRSYIPDCCPVLVVLRQHVTEFGIDEILSRHVPEARIAVAEKLTGGSLETCMLAQKAVLEAGGGDHPMVALDGDLVFRSSPYLSLLQAMNGVGRAPDGALLSFHSMDPRYSFAEMQDGYVVRTAEKVAISDNALVGAYAFRRAAAFFGIGEKIIADNARVANGEFYTSAAYNRLIEGGGKVALAGVEDYWSMGTPEELAASMAAPGFRALLDSLKG